VLRVRVTQAGAFASVTSSGTQRQSC